MKVNLVMPTIKDERAMRSRLEAIASLAGTPVTQIVISNPQYSCAMNRSLGMDRCQTGDVIVMIDDDVYDLKEDWCSLLIQPLLREGGAHVMVAPRLLDSFGNPQWHPGSKCVAAIDSIRYTRVDWVTGACFAFIKNSVNFDLNLVGWGYEDYDFCLELSFADKLYQFWIDETVVASHMNERKNCKTTGMRNVTYFGNKWRQRLPGRF
jgi:hypothetical protein